MRLIACLALIVFTPFSLALEVFENSGEARHYLFAEGGRWHVDAIAEGADQWPEVQDGKIFNTEDAARAYLIQIGARAVPAAKAIINNKELVNRSGATLWPVTNQWTWDWEVKFGEWVKTQLHVSWWKQYGIATDCADVAYTARWIFARNNGLPAANTMVSGGFFTHRSVKTEWETLPTAPEWYNDQKFMAALNFLMKVTYTHTLWTDSYPVAINAASLIPGTYHLHLADQTGHTMLVNSVGTKPEEVPVSVLYSSIPSDIRDLWSAIFLDETADAGGAGFLHMRWPQWAGDVVSLVPAAQMPKYSIEQWDPGFIQSPRRAFWQEVYYRLNPRADFEKIAFKTLEQLLDGFKTRVQIVDRGYAVCSVNKCAEGSPEYNLWSTPSRDGRLLGTVGVFDELGMQIGNWSQFAPLFSTNVVTIDHQSLDLAEVMRIWRANGYSSDPNDSPEVRWGM